LYDDDDADDDDDNDDEMNLSTPFKHYRFRINSNFVQDARNIWDWPNPIRLATAEIILRESTRMSNERLLVLRLLAYFVIDNL